MLKIHVKTYLLLILLVFKTTSLIAAPLESGYPLAPRASAPPEEKASAYLDARNRVLDEAEKYLGAPYRYAGTTINGMDCSGLIFVSFRDALGVSVPRTASSMYSWVERISRDRVQPGDLVFFRTDSSGSITHVGFYLGNGRFIHAASAGSRTGVIISNLSESYWSGTFAGAGRALPETPPGTIPAPAPQQELPVHEPEQDDTNRGDTDHTSGTGRTRRNRERVRLEPAKPGEGQLLLGIAAAPTWNAFLPSENAFRGFTTQFRLAADTSVFNKRMVFGLEIRPEYDIALGVYRIPFTFSWGPNDQVRLFAGPVLSFGEPSLTTEDGETIYYSGGTSWMGSAGITLAPFIFRTGIGEIAPYMEAAWQYYFNETENKDVRADFSAAFRFSTGIRWSIRVR